MSGYRLHVLDLRGWKPFRGKKKPEGVYTQHKTRADADAARATLPQHEDAVSTITAIPPPQTRAPREARRDETEPDPMGGRMHSKGRRLTL